MEKDPREIKLSQFIVKRHGLDNTRGKLNDYSGTAHAQGDFTSFRAIFNWVSKVIRDTLVLLKYARWFVQPENSRHILNQSDAKLKPNATNATLSLAFSRACGRLHVFPSSSHWLFVIQYSPLFW